MSAAVGGGQAWGGVDGTARRASGLQGQGRRGLPLYNPGPSVSADRHLPESQEGLTNVRGNYDYPCVRDVRQINHSNHSSAHSELPALGSRAAFPFPAPLDKAGFCFMCWIEGGPNVIWKPRWDNGAAQAGYLGQARCNVLWKDVVGAGGEGEVIEAMGFPGILRVKRIYVLANYLLPSLLSLTTIFKAACYHGRLGEWI